MFAFPDSRTKFTSRIYHHSRSPFPLPDADEDPQVSDGEESESDGDEEGEGDLAEMSIVLPTSCNSLNSFVLLDLCTTRNRHRHRARGRCSHPDTPWLSLHLPTKHPATTTFRDMTLHFLHSPLSATCTGRQPCPCNIL